MPDRAGQHLGNYRLLRLLGSGGFADVYLAEHLLLKTNVAIKLLHTQLLQTVMESFIDEARTIDSLHHPHIVRVRDFGIDPQDNTLFLVMDYAPNGSLRDRHPLGSKLPLETVITYVKQAADALQHAHDAKRIHRDIKPENMLLGYHHEVILSDFGLAAVAHTTGSLKTQGDAGTIYYMSPEQIKGKPRPASDQYSLAVTVYEWLSGTRPFDGDLPIEIAMKHVMEPPPPLRDHAPTLPQGVVDVIMKGLSKQPEDRYATIKAFAEALELGSKPQAAPAVVEVRERVNKPPVQPIGFGTPFPFKDLARQTATTMANTSQVQPISMTLVTYKEFARNVISVAWSPDGTRIVSGHDRGSASVWDASTGNSLFSCNGHTGSVNSVAWSPDGTHLASASRDKTVRVWDAASGKSLLVCSGHRNTVWSVAWSFESKRLASASVDGTIRVWNPVTGRSLLTCGGFASVTWSPNSNRFASGNLGSKVQVWDAISGKSLLTCVGHGEIVWSVAWSPNGTKLASASGDKTVRVWDVVTGKSLLVCHGHTEAVYSVVWSTDGRKLASASEDKTVRIWDASTGKCLYEYKEHTDQVRSVAWSPDGTRIASASDDKTVRVWSVG